MASDSPDSYLSVREAIEELRRAKATAIANAPQQVKPVPNWAHVHAREDAKRSKFMATFSQPGSPISPKKAGAFPQPGSPMMASTVSNTSSLPAHGLRTQTVLNGLQSLSDTKLNSMSTHVHGNAPLIPSMAADNAYSSVGLYSMFGSQAMSARHSSASFGFGSTTREQQQLLYLTPAHLKVKLCQAGAPTGSYEVPSSLGPQVLDHKFSYPARSFSLEGRFAAYRRDFSVRITPGPGAYRV